MFWNKKEQIVSCEVCNCLLFEKDAAQVIERSLDALLYSKKKLLYYCIPHAPKYERVNKLFGSISYEKIMTVDEQGEPIGYEKRKAK